MPTNHAIVGREAELQQLREVVESAVRPVVAFVAGDAGVGKTALLEAIVGQAEEGGTRVLRARPTAAEAASSFAALDDLLRPAIEGLPRLAEPQRRALAAALLLEAAIDPVDPRLVGLACLSLLEALPGRVLLAVDDWQWLDAASAAVLSFVLRRLEPGGAKVIATVRRGEADEAVAGLVRALPVDQAIELAVGPLDPGALGRLVHARTGTWMAPPALARLHAACDGNPLLALELVRAPGAEAASDIRRLLAARVGALAPETRTVLRFVAALAEPTLAAVEAAIDAPAGLEEALATDVLVREGGRLRFSHPLIGAVVQERTPPGEWRAIHARLAELADHPEQRARHLAAAADGTDEDVAAALEAAAGEAATRGATMAAAELAQRAAEMTPDADRQAPAVDRRGGRGDGRRRRAERPRLARRGRRRGRSPGRCGRARSTGSPSWSRTTARCVSPRARSRRRAMTMRCAPRFISRRRRFATMGGEMPRALRHAEAGARHAEAAGATVATRGRALLDRVHPPHRRRGGAARAAGASRRARARRRGPVRRERRSSSSGCSCTSTAKLAESRRLLTGELERAQARGRIDHESMALMLLAELEVRAGRWQLADGYAAQTLDLTLGTESWNAEAAGHWTRAVVDAHLGRVDSAREHAETGRRQAEALGDLAFATRCSHVLGFVALSLGDADAAVRHLGPLRECEQRLGVGEPAAFCIAPDLAEALVLAGDLDAARAVQEELEARGRELGRAWAIATGLRCRGLIAAAEGRSDDALTALHEAIAVHAEVPQPFDRARTLLVLGTTQRRFKQRAEARSSLEAGLAVFEELGAALWAERARAEIARLGGRRARDRDELSETERRIAELAAGGRSNREIAGELFVSERTVESNLTRAYRKLGVRSRTELARRLPGD